MSYETKIGKKFQVVIPQAIRQKKNLKEGDAIIWDINEATGQITIMVKPQNFAQHIRGLGKEIWRQVDSDNYLEGERNSWQ